MSEAGHCPSTRGHRVMKLASLPFLMMAASSAANPIYRCTGNDGSITFTQISGPHCEPDDVQAYTPPAEEVARQKEALKQWRANREEISKSATQKPTPSAPASLQEGSATGNSPSTNPLLLPPPIQYMTPVETDN